MNVAQLERRLASTDEIEITVTGRVSGQPVAHTVWFVQEGDQLYLVPVRGSDSDWFKNVLKMPVIRISAGGAEVTAAARPITDPVKVRAVVEKFRAKYGADQVSKYYSKLDVAVEVPLQREARHA
jgi:deazaflavin-dependent oxidoreductase (nitroreductase family)